VYALIDWLSFTVSGSVGEGEDNDACWALAWDAIRKTLGGYADLLVAGQDFTWANGRAPYLFSKSRTDGGVRVFFDRRRKEVLVEMSGTGCALARDDKALEHLALLVSNAVTRVDLTVDILCDVTPSAFVNAGFSKRFKSGGQQFSESGETVYVGSWKSNRFARVYRYNPPHPRSDCLRVEHVFRDESATAALYFLASSNLTGCLAACGQVFGWVHPVWSPDDLGEDTRLTSGRDPKSDRDTVFWLYRSVVPALARLLLEDRVTLEHFLGAVSEAMRRAEPDPVASPDLALGDDNE